MDQLSGMVPKGPNFELMHGLLPAVIQDCDTSEVLMVGYLNPEAWKLTLSQGKMHYSSRKKERIWLKGEQSGHYQFVKEVFLNCDNTCLLVKVEQIGGACDLGLKSCFDKVLRGQEFHRTGVKVFDPHDAYGENYTQKITLGIPSGSLEKITFKLLEMADYEVIRTSDRSYHPEVANRPNIDLFMARAQELPIFVEQGVLDAAITGIDMVEESGVSVKDVIDLGYNKLGLGKVVLALAVPIDNAAKQLEDFEGIRVATAYQNLTRRFFGAKDISVQVVPSVGATEGKVPLLADAVVELVETGATVKTNDLKPIIELFETTVHFIASTEAWSYTWKRRRLEQIAEELKNGAHKLPQNPKTTIELTSNYTLPKKDYSG